MDKPSWSTVTRKLGVCLNTLKYILAAVCLILFIIGIVIFGIGIATEIDSGIVEKLKLPTITSFPIWLIIIGLVLAIVSIWGVIGGCANKRSFLIVFIILIVIILVAELAIGITAVSMQGETRQFVNNSWGSSTNETREYFEQEFRCCGFATPFDRAYLPGCVADESESDSAIFVYSSTKYYTTGCGQKLLDFVHNYMTQIIAIVFATFAIEVVILVFASILAYRIKVIHNNYTNMDEPQDNLFG